jgi:hypothetical protein
MVEHAQSVLLKTNLAMLIVAFTKALRRFAPPFHARVR